MDLYVFGNQDLASDNSALEIANYVKDKFKDEVNTIFVKPNEDLPFAYEDRVVIIDVIRGISEVKIFTEEDINSLKFAKSTTAHDYDLGFQLKYLKKLNKLKRIRIIGIPQEVTDFELVTWQVKDYLTQLIADPFNF